MAEPIRRPAGWRKVRMPRFPTERPITVVPDWVCWVCEVLSPSSLRRDRVVKADLYLRSGVPHYWLVDTEGRILEAFEALAFFIRARASAAAQACRMHGISSKKCEQVGRTLHQLAPLGDYRSFPASTQTG